MTFARTIRNKLPLIDRRKYPRRTKSVRFRIGGNTYRVRDYSPGGFGLGSYHETVRVGDMIEGRVLQLGLRRHGDFTAQVMRVTENGYVGFRFIDLSSLLFRALNRL